MIFQEPWCGQRPLRDNLNSPYVPKRFIVDLIALLANNLWCNLQKQRVSLRETNTLFSSLSLEMNSNFVLQRPSISKWQCVLCCFRLYAGSKKNCFRAEIPSFRVITLLFYSYIHDALVIADPIFIVKIIANFCFVDLGYIVTNKRF